MWVSPNPLRSQTEQSQRKKKFSHSSWCGASIISCPPMLELLGFGNCTTIVSGSAPSDGILWDFHPPKWCVLIPVINLLCLYRYFFFTSFMFFNIWGSWEQQSSNLPQTDQHGPVHPERQNVQDFQLTKEMYILVYLGIVLLSRSKISWLSRYIVLSGPNKVNHLQYGRG